MAPGRRRWRAVGGIVGPVVFVGTWWVLGRRRGDGYSPIDDPISRLAAVDAPDRWAMTAGFLVYGAGVGLYATELRRVLPAAAAGAAATALASVGVAATPVESAIGGTPHAIAAVTAYATLAATPLLAAPELAASGRRRAAAASVAIGVACGSALLASLVSTTATGGFQRLGLTLGDAWIVATACWLLRDPPARRSGSTR